MTGSSAARPPRAVALPEAPVAVPETPEMQLPKNIRSIPPQRVSMPHQTAGSARAQLRAKWRWGCELEGALHGSRPLPALQEAALRAGLPGEHRHSRVSSPRWRARDIRASYRILKQSNALPAVCGRVCPQETQCEATCVVGAKFQPVAIGRLERFVADFAMGRGWDETPDAAARRRAEARRHHRLRPRRPGLRRRPGARRRRR